MLSKKKKVFILVGMVALLVLTGCLNIFLNKKSENVSGEVDKTTVTQNSIERLKKDRLAAREETMLYLDSIINNTASSEEAVTEATLSKQKLAENTALEATLEGLIYTIGFEDVFVLINTNNINVIVKSPDLDEISANRILDAVLRETDRPATGVYIIPLE